MRITIIGAGNAGVAHSAMMTLRGHDVTLLKTTHLMYEDTFEQLARTRRVRYVKGNEEGAVQLAAVTRDIQHAISSADFIFILTQSVAHELLSRQISQYFRDGQTVVVSPGYCGSFFFSTKCKGRNILFAEGESLPFDSRIIEPGRVFICSENVRNPLGAFPAKRTDELLERARQILPNYTARNNILESAFHNPNLIVHTVGAIMSVGRIEYSKGEFWMYREAFTPTIWNLVEALDAEKIAILKYFGLPPQRFVDSFHLRNYEDMSVDPMVAFTHYAQHGSPKGPANAQTRYITEDVPMGLCFLSSVGKKIGIATPVCDSLIQIATALHRTDYYARGRTLENLGLGAYSRDEFNQLLTKGFPDA